MHRKTSQYPISIFLSAFYSSLDIPVRDFVKLLGYGSVSKGINRFDRWLQEGRGEHDFIEKLVRTFPELQFALDEALQKTDSLLWEESEKSQGELDREEETRFRPYIYLETKEQRPSSIALFTVSGGQSKFIRLPEQFASWTKEAQFVAAKRAIAEHRKERGGFCVFFGPVIAYRLVRSLSETVLFDTEANIISEQRERFRIPFATWVTPGGSLE